MTESSRLFFTGNTLDQAVMAAATHYDLEPDELAYERVERRTGFLRGRRRVVIRVDSNSPQRQEGKGSESLPQSEDAAVVGQAADPEESAAEKTVDPEIDLVPAPAEEAVENAVVTVEEVEEQGSGEQGPPEESEPRQPSKTQERRRYSSFTEPDIADLPRAAAHAVEAVERGVALLAALGDLELTADVYEGEDQLVVEIGGADQQRVVRGEGRLLLALQHLLPRVLHGITGEMTPCRVDSRGFRKTRVQALEEIAREAADEVRRGGRPKTLAPMNPADRRTIHLALEEDADVTTESAGHGFFKSVTVRPV
jgi:spoIIIJ-associated protein